MKKKWTVEADEEVCKSVLSGTFDDKKAEQISEKYDHPKASVKKRARNYEHLKTGGKKGLSHYSNQTKETYNRLSKL